MAQIILTFGLGKRKNQGSPQYCSKNRIQIKEISRKDYNQKLGASPGFRDLLKKK